MTNLSQNAAIVAIIRCGKKITNQTRARMKMDNWSRTNRANYTNKNSKGQYRLKREAKAASIGVYFFLVVLAVAFTLALAR